MRIGFRLTMAVGVALASVVCGGSPSETQNTATTQSMIGNKAITEFDLQIYFDGGYAVLFDDAAGTVRIASFQADKNDPEMNHRMVMDVRRGEYVSGAGGGMNGQMESESKSGYYLDGTLKGQSFKMSIQGQTAAPVKVARNYTTPPKCDDTVNEDDAIFIPNIVDLARKAKAANAAIDTNFAGFKNEITLAGGELHVDHLSPTCWEYRDAKGNKLPAQKFASGSEGIVYRAKIKGSELRLSFDGAGKQFVVLSPVVSRKFPDGIISMTIGRMEGNCDPNGAHGMPKCLAVNDVNPDFHRFYTLLKNGPDATSWFLPYKLTRTLNVTPGDECPPGSGGE